MAENVLQFSEKTGGAACRNRQQCSDSQSCSEMQIAENIYSL